MAEEEPPFLKGHGRTGLDLSPIKIVKVRNDWCILIALSHSWILFPLVSFMGSFSTLVEFYLCFFHVISYTD